MLTGSVVINFIRKRASPDTAFKVFTTQRFRHTPQPVQIHLGYLPDRDVISDVDMKGIEDSLQRKWKLYTDDDPFGINWADALDKWQRRERKRHRVNRRHALLQINAWLSNEDELLLKGFKGPKNISVTCSKDQFIRDYSKFAGKIARRLPQADPVDVAEWWELLECPRLLIRYREYLKRKKLQSTITRLGFIRFLSTHIALGYAYGEFMRRLARNREHTGAWDFEQLSDWDYSDDSYD